jgi:O-antigen/teichoic acid export membrane protein
MAALFVPNAEPVQPAADDARSPDLAVRATAPEGSNPSLPRGYVRSADFTRVQIRGSTLLLAGQGFALLANLATQVLLVRYLSKSSFGAFAYGLSIVALCETVAALGLRRGVSQFMPAYEERGELAKAAGLLVFGLATVLGLGLAAALIVIGLRGVLTSSLADGQEAATLLAILIVLVPVHTVEYMLDAVYSVFARPRAILTRKYVYAPLMRLTVVALLALSASGVTFVAIGYVIAGIVGIVVYAAFLSPVLREHGLTVPLRSRRMTFPVREVVRFSLPMLTHDVSGVLMITLGTLLLGAMRNARVVAELRAVMPVALTLSYVLGTFGILFVPLASRLLERQEGEKINRIYWQTAAWGGVFSLPIFLIGSLFSHPLTVLLFGRRYSDAAGVLAVLMIGYFVTVACGPNGALLGVYREVRYVVWSNVAAVIVNLALSVILIIVAGALGAALAVTATLLLLNGVWQYGLKRRTHVRGFDTTYLSLYLLMGAVSAALAVVQLLIAPGLAIGIVLVGSAWLLVLVGARRQLDVAETFGDIVALPPFRWLVRS